MDERIGFIGLGDIGTPMARRILEGGYRVASCAHRRREAIEMLKASGLVEGRQTSTFVSPTALKSIAEEASGDTISGHHRRRAQLSRRARAWGRCCKGFRRSPLRETAWFALAGQVFPRSAGRERPSLQTCQLAGGVAGPLGFQTLGTRRENLLAVTQRIRSDWQRER